MPQSSPAIAQAPSAPRTAAELRALRTRREELKEQLESTTEWRGRLVQERHNASATGNSVVVQELDGRIAELGTRSVQLERAMLQADDAIAQALAKGVGTREAEVTVTNIPGVPGVPSMPRIPEIPTFPIRIQGGYSDRDMAALALGEALAFVILGFVLWRLAFRRGQRSVQAAPSRDAAQLQQSVDAIALEVERISENQRFVTKLLNEQGERVPADKGDR